MTERPLPDLGQSTREVLLSLPGLWLGDERIAESHALLCKVAEEARGGLLPTYWPLHPSRARSYDALSSLYFVEAVRLLVAYSKKQRLVDGLLYDTVLDIVRNLASGTTQRSFVDDDGLLVAAGQKTVEAAALWHNALRTASDLAQARSAPLLSAELKALAKRTQTAAEHKLWRNDAGHFIDAPESSRGATSMLTPECLLPFSLGYPMLDRASAKRMLEVVDRELFTPRGLRSMPRSHPNYDGGRRTRFPTGGAALPYALGSYCRLAVYALGSVESAKSKIEAAISPLLDKYSEDDLVLDIPEAFTGDAPYESLGRAVFPPSRAELLRAYDECILGKGPSPEHVEKPVSLAPIAMRWEISSE